MDINERHKIESAIYKPADENEIRNSGLPGDRYEVAQDDVHEILSNMTYVRNQLLQEILEYSGIELKDVNPESQKQDPLEEAIDEDPHKSISYKNEAYVEEEKNYAINRLNIKSNLYIRTDNKSVGDLICDWWKNGKIVNKEKTDAAIADQMDASFGGFVPNVDGWNIQKSIEHLINHSHPSSTHRCAKYVREAIEAGGISTAGHPMNAKDYVGFLPKLGFKLFGTVTGNDVYAQYMANKAVMGDIAVYKNPRNPSAPGHICMYTGKQWISDFRQNRMWVYGGSTYTAYIFRFVNIKTDPNIKLTEGVVLNLKPGGSMRGVAAHTNNPGNITGSGYYKQNGKYKRFASFPHVVYGIRAWFSWIERWRKKYPTLTAMWNYYAPSNENNTTGYIASIAKSIKINPNSPLPPVMSAKNLYWGFARACFKFECSYSPPDDVLAAAWDMFIKNPTLV